MRQPVRRRRKSKEWMLTYGITALFVLGSLWYLDLLPLGQSTPPNANQAGNDSDADGLSDPIEARKEAEAALAAIEQWEPEVTTTEDVNSELSATPASLAGERLSPASAESPFPPAPETEPENATVASDFSPDTPPSESERERIARIFGTQTSPAKEPTAEPGDSGIVPTSAETPAAAFPPSNDSFAQADLWIAEGQYLKAHRDLSQRYWKENEPLEPLLQRLNKTAGMIYFAPQPHFMQPYEVQSGDLLQSVAPQYKLSWEYLARLNRVRPERIRAGQKLKVIKGPFSAFVDLSDFTLTIHAHGYFVKRYAIGIGKDNSTPIGTFSVKDKLKNPKYYGADEVVEADDLNNPLGERWIDIGDSYGIHGTIDPASIGKAESRGCLRLTNEDVIEVYDFLTQGSEVVIRP